MKRKKERKKLICPFLTVQMIIYILLNNPSKVQFSAARKMPFPAALFLATFSWFNDNEFPLQS